jgi:hypothetical protein
VILNNLTAINTITTPTAGIITVADITITIILPARLPPNSGDGSRLPWCWLR